MIKKLIFIAIIVILSIAAALSCRLEFKKLFINKETKKKIIMPEKSLKNKKIAMIIAFKDFRDEEYFVPKEILETAGAEVKTVSNQTGTAVGADGGEAEVQISIENLNMADFDAIVFVGGPGALKYLDNENSYRVANETVSQGKLLAAICISPVILAKAGVLEGKKATVWSSPFNKESVRILQDKGAIYFTDSVVRDGKIITASGPTSAKEFGENIADLLTRD